MEFIVNMMLFSMLWKLSTSIKCYKCDPEKSAYVYQNRLCSDFDYSEDYITNCEYSTICVKKVTTLNIHNEMRVSSVYRGCAPQTIRDDQEKRGGKWYSVKKIYEEYEEGCSEPADPDKVTQTTICYCKGDLCNSAPSMATNLFVLTLITSIVIIILG